MNVPNWVVEKVEPREDYTLLITFASGEQKIYDASHLLEYKIFEPLKNIDFFMTARVIYDAVGWNDRLDLDPCALYADGVPVEVSHE